uniref:Adenosine 5'-monophosphoramidase HINT3 n=1 Tax=Caligus rogercresseyi TaxID=217165 RepID=C1BPQ9_CALRO|nr:Histidine triad nucleotide-binding protein 3 [Caligus rogercresseyi]
MSARQATCVFCQIAGKQIESKIRYEDSQFVAFPDRSPASKHHYLIIPKEHHPKVNLLGPSESHLLEAMGKIAEQVLEENGASVSDAKIGFHWPIVSVHHLHLHAISPASQMSSLFKKIEFSSAFFGTLPDAIAMLQKNNNS